MRPRDYYRTRLSRRARFRRELQKREDDAIAAAHAREPSRTAALEAENIRLHDALVAKEKRFAAQPKGTRVHKLKDGTMFIEKDVPFADVEDLKP